MKLKAVVFVLTMATYAQADHHSLQIDDCSKRSIARSHAGYLVEPWVDNTRYLPKHNLRFVVLGNGMPSSRAYYLMILGNPPQDDPSEVGPRLCRIVTIDGPTGFSKIEMGASSVEEVRLRGRDSSIFTVPVQITSEAGTSRRQMLSVGYQHERGSITAKLEDP